MSFSRYYFSKCLHASLSLKSSIHCVYSRSVAGLLINLFTSEWARELPIPHPNPCLITLANEDSFIGTGFGIVCTVFDDLRFDFMLYMLYKFFNEWPNCKKNTTIVDQHTSLVFILCFYDFKRQIQYMNPFVVM